jgi:L-seryl-tRNA(Ser) seleniumtransferase
MSAHRRGFLRSLCGLPALAATPQAAAAEPLRDVYRELGVRPIINAAGTFTFLGGSLMAPETLAALNAAARQFVNLGELQAAVSKKIAALLGCEAALVTCGAASALTLATAACVAGKDRDRISRLPDTTSMKNEVIIQKAHRYGYDHAVRNVGVRLVEVVTAQDLERSAHARTALLLFFNDANDRGQIKVDEFARLGKKLGVPTLNDAAADVPPVENFTRYLKMGYDLVCFSGGKIIRGPQAAGLLLGRTDLIEAAALHNNPNTDAIGRTNKVGKEELVAMWAAVERFVKLDHAAVWRDWEQRVKTIAGLATEVKGVQTEQFVPPIANHSPHLRITWDYKATGLTPTEVADQLRAGEPSIMVRPDVPEAVEVAVWMLEPGQDEVVGKRIRDLLKKR